MTKIKPSIPIVSVEKISKKYFLQKQSMNNADAPNQDFFWALNNISFSLNHGDVLGIIGPNGSGKSTLLKILSQTTKPTLGKVTRHGKLISILEIGTGFHPDLTGRENVYLSGMIALGMSKEEITSNISRIIEFSELGRFIDEPVKHYSNGMYLRLAFSLALLCKLDLLILDEVFTVGDSSFMVKCYEKMNDIIEEGATIILATHNLTDILRICNKCLWLENGETKMIGGINEVISSYMAANLISLENNSGTESIILSAEKTWQAEDAPQTEHFRLAVISIGNEGDGSPRSLLDYNEPIRIEITYNKVSNSGEIGLGLMLTDYLGAPLLYTSHSLNFNEITEFLKETGLYRRTCIIPARSLNIGIYKIGLQVFLYQDGNSATPLLNMPNLLIFKVTSESKRQTDILKNIPVRFASLFNWSLTRLN